MAVAGCIPANLPLGYDTEETALVIRLDGEIDGVVAVRIDDGLVTGLYFVRNPQKLSRIAPETTVNR